MIFLISILVAALLLLAVVSAGAGKGSRRSRAGKSGPRVDIKAAWRQIEAVAASGPAGLKNAISDADKLFDQAMKQQGAKGETMAERLKSSRQRFSSHSIYEQVWHAHKYRNALAHEVGFDLVPSQAKDALRGFEKGLKDMGAL